MKNMNKYTKLSISFFLSIILLSIITISCNTKPNESKIFTDSRDGKNYKYVKIGDQEWMMENFAFKADTGCWAYDNDEANVAKYGYLYTYETAKNICPDGWHIPSAEECNVLIDYLGGQFKAFYKMLEPSDEYWGMNNSDKINNRSGFSAIPAGCYMYNVNKFMYKDEFAFWWTSSKGSENDKIKQLGTNNKLIDIRNSHKLSGLSVRYIKD